MRNRIFAIALTSLLCLPATAAGTWTLTSVGPWTEVGSVSVSQDERLMVFSQKTADGKEQAFEARSNGGTWGTAKPIAPVNALGTVGGLFMSDDCRRIYFHAKTDGGTDYDLYWSERKGGEWGKPKRIADLCTGGDEMFPSMTEGGQEMYFVRGQAPTDRKGDVRMAIYHTKLGKDGKWARILPINPAISFGYVHDARIMRDGVTMLYSTRPERRDKARPVFTRKTVAEQWLLPEFMNEDDSRDFFCLQNAGASLYMVVPTSRKSEYGTIFRTSPIDAKYSTKPMATEVGTVLNSQSRKPVAATLEIRNPTTNDLVGLYTSDPDNGAFHIVNSPDASYTVEVRSSGHSFYSGLLTYDKSGHPQMPRAIELFDTASVGVSMFDGDIFQPVDGKVIAVRQRDKAIFRSSKGRKGWYGLRLPIGDDYNIIGTAKGFAENKFIFKSSGDITFDHYERELPLSPARRDVSLRIFDKETNAPIAATALFKSLDCDETLGKEAGTAKVSLREGDRYDVTIRHNGYMFVNFSLDLTADKRTQIDIALTALRPGTVLLLHNILFDNNMAFLRPESYAELDRVVRLMGENPGMKIEVLAHTDNVGSAASNQKLSDRRAASAVQYLFENGVTPGRMKATGLGATKPIADNATEEGRQLNRRVELLITE